MRNELFYFGLKLKIQIQQSFQSFSSKYIYLYLSNVSVQRLTKLNFRRAQSQIHPISDCNISLSDHTTVASIKSDKSSLYARGFLIPAYKILIF